MDSIKLTSEQSQILYYLLHRMLFSGDNCDLKSAERSTLTELLASITENGTP